MEDLSSLVARAQAGDLDAYGQIVQRFQDMAYGYAYSILGDFHLAEDATQEAFVQAYRQLARLRESKAFPGWLRRIVSKYCDRMTRGKHLPTVPLETAAEPASVTTEPARTAEDREMKDAVLQAIRSLPDDERQATTLFYINGYSQKDIADFLEIPVTTVNNRLHSSRKRLKERMIAMVKDTLHNNAPDERFSKKIIEELLGRPHLLEIEGHPVQEVWKIIQAALPDYDVIEGKEVISESAIANPWCRQFAYHLDSGSVLRTETTTATFAAMVGRMPPVRLVTAGRVFHSGRSDIPTKVSHGLDVLCVTSDTTRTTMESTLQTIFEAVFGPVELKYEKATFHWFDPCMKISAKCHGKSAGAGSGMMTAKTLKDAGYDPRTVGGFAIGIGLDLWAMLKYGIDDIRKLWQPPYVPK